MKPKEIWKSIVNFPDYEISNRGSIRRVRPSPSKYSNKWQPDRILRPSPNGQGYYHVSLIRDGKQYTQRIHYLVAAAFLDRPKGIAVEINHKDGHKINNSSKNLEYVTCKQNHHHAAMLGLKACGIRIASAKLTWEDVQYIRNSNLPSGELSNILGVSRGHVNSIKRFKYRKVA